MQQQERELISGLFDRLKPFETQPRDAEADQFIRGLAAQQPASAYLLVQTVLVQEQALKAAQERIAELEAKTAAEPPVAPSFLGSAPRLGPWGAAAAPRTSVPRRPLRRVRRCRPQSRRRRRSRNSRRRPAAASCGRP